MGIGIDDIMAAHGISSLAGGGGGRFVSKTARVSSVAETASVTIPVSLEYNPERDMLVAFQNTVFMQIGLDYRLSDNKLSIQKLTDAWEKDTNLDFIVLKNMKASFPTYDGTLIKNGSITEAKLSAEVRNRLTASADFNGVLARVDDVEEKALAMREAAANAMLQVEASDLVASGTNFGGNGTFTFGVTYHTAQTTTNNILDVGNSILTGKVLATNVFKVGERVTLYDDTQVEVVTVTKASATELEVTPLTKSFKSGTVVARSTFNRLAAGGGFEFPKWNNVGVKTAHARMTIGTTDECILWLTVHKDLTATLKATFAGGAETTVAGEQVRAIAGTNDVVLQYLVTNPTAAALSLDLTLTRASATATGKLVKFLGGIG